MHVLYICCFLSDNVLSCSSRTAIDELECRARSCFCLSLNKLFVVVVVVVIIIILIIMILITFVTMMIAQHYCSIFNLCIDSSVLFHDSFSLNSFSGCLAP